MDHFIWQKLRALQKKTSLKSQKSEDYDSLPNNSDPNFSQVLFEMDSLSKTELNNENVRDLKKNKSFSHQPENNENVRDPNKNKSCLAQPEPDEKQTFDEDPDNYQKNKSIGFKQRSNLKNQTSNITNLSNLSKKNYEEFIFNEKNNKEYKSSKSLNSKNNEKIEDFMGFEKMYLFKHYFPKHNYTEVLAWIKRKMEYNIRKIKASNNVFSKRNLKFKKAFKNLKIKNRIIKELKDKNMK